MPFYIIVSYFIVWPIIMFSSAYFFYKLPKSSFRLDSFFFKERPFELGGKLYEKVFFVHKWKELLPDGAALFKSGFKKKRLRDTSEEYLEEFLLESCRAEATHIPPIFLSLLFGLYNPPHVVVIMVAFGIAANLPCILAQRYNRIRIQKLLKRKRNKAHLSLCVHTKKST